MLAVKGAKNIVHGVAHSPPQGLRSFLIRDTGDLIFRHHYPVCQDKVNMNISIPGQGMMGQICGLKGLNRLHVAVRQEKMGSQMVKVLYGWGKEAEWGDLSQLRVKYILARGRAGQNNLNLLKRPEPLFGLTERQKPYRATGQMARVLREGLGKRKFGRGWKVIRQGSSCAFVQYHLDGIVRLILGFNGYRSVYSVMTEENDQIIGRFYPSRNKARTQTDLLKVVVFSVKNDDWDPLVKPQIIETSPVSKDQYAKIQNRRVREFIKAEVADGDFLDLGPYRVYGDGTVRLVLSSDLDAERNMTFAGYRGQSQLVGRLIREGGVKKIYFWPDEASREANKPPFIPSGHLVAKFIDWKGWKIAWRGIGKRRQETERLGNYLFATVGDKRYICPWPVKTLRRPSGLIRRAEKRVRGTYMGLPMTDFPLNGPSIISVAREIGERMKFIEFWRDKASYRKGERPLTARFIMARKRPEPEPNGNGWFTFWVKLDQVKAFKQLIKQGIFTRRELSQVLENRYLMAKYPDQMYNLIDGIPLY